MLIGVILGLDEICPVGYKGGLAGFFKDTAAGKHDLWLHEQGIYISPIMKPLLKNMLMVDQYKRYTMQQVIDHPYITKNVEAYSKGYDEWCQLRIVELQKLKEEHASILSLVEEDHKEKFKRLDDHSKKFYLDQEDEGRYKFMAKSLKAQALIMNQPEVLRHAFLFDKLTAEDKTFIDSLDDESKLFFINMFIQSRQDFKALYKDQQLSYLNHCKRIER